MGRTVTHLPIVEFHKQIAIKNNAINGFYRFNVAELLGQLRSGLNAPILALESHSSELEGNGVSNFNGRAISFLVLDHAGRDDEYDKQDEVLDAMEQIVLDIISYLKQLHGDKTSWLYGKFEINTVKYEKVGPVFGDMYGWNVLYTLKNHEPMKVDATKWDFERTEF